MAPERKLGLEGAPAPGGTDAAPFSGKHSTPYAPDSVHDFMHAKVTVADDIVFVGSFNLSHSGEMNAENVLEIADPGSPTGWPASSTGSGCDTRNRRIGGPSKR